MQESSDDVDEDLYNDNYNLNLSSNDNKDDVIDDESINNLLSKYDFLNKYENNLNFKSD